MMDWMQPTASALARPAYPVLLLALVAIFKQAVRQAYNGHYRLFVCSWANQ
jgi:hypothetical protein